MSSGARGINNMFLSTHNALRVAEEEDDQLWIAAHSLDTGKRTTIFVVFPFYDVEMLKHLIIKHARLPKSTNISDISVLVHGMDLANQKSLDSFCGMGKRGTADSPIRIHWGFRTDDSDVSIRELGMKCPPGLQRLMAEMELAVQRGIHPKLAVDGTAGTYFMDGCQGCHLGVFKPTDEEPFTPFNPHGFTGTTGQRGFRAGVLSGEGAQREVAAFLIDAAYGYWIGVPETTKVEVKHAALNYSLPGALPGERAGRCRYKEGSLQEFILGAEPCGDFDSSEFAVSDCHRIAIFDLHLLNMDRNDCNILVRPRGTSSSSSPSALAPHQQTSTSDLTPNGRVSNYRLVPIDHGLVMPDTMDVGDIDFVWYSWPHSKLPFSRSEVRYILSLDAAHDQRRLGRKLGIRADCLRSMRASSTILKIGCRLHLSITQIASLVVRTGDLEEPSFAERAVQAALGQAYLAIAATGLKQNARMPGRYITDLHVTLAALKSVDDGNAWTSSSSSSISSGSHSDEDDEGIKRSSTKKKLRIKKRLPTVIPEDDEYESTTEDEPKQIDVATTQQSANKPSASNASAIDQRVPSQTAQNNVEDSSTDSLSTASEDEDASGDDEDEDDGEDDDGDDDDDDSSVYGEVSKLTGIPLHDPHGTIGVPRKSRRKGKRIKSHQGGISALPAVAKNLPEATVAALRAVAAAATSKTPSAIAPAAATQPSRGESSATRPPVVGATQISKGGHGTHGRGQGAEDTSSRHPTVRKPSALARRGTTKRAVREINSWTLWGTSTKDPIPIDWDNPNFERIFFEYFGNLVVEKIIEMFPDWESFPFHGEKVLRDMGVGENEVLPGRLNGSIPLKFEWRPPHLAPLAPKDK